MKVLLLYYSFTRQTERVAEAMAEAFVKQGCDVDRCAIEFDDPRHQISYPFKPFFWWKLLRWIYPQVMRKTGQIRSADFRGLRDPGNGRGR